MNKHNRLEQELVDNFINLIKRQAKNEKGVSIEVTQLESGATSLGIPDLLLFMEKDKEKTTVWVECKRLDSKDTPSGNNRCTSMKGSVHFRPGQLRMLHKLRNYGNKACILIISQTMDICVLDPLKFPIETEHLRVKENGVTATYSLPYLLTQLL